MQGFSHFYCFVAVICSLLIFCSAANAQQQANSQAQQTEAQDDGVDAVKDQSAEPTEHTETEITGEEAQQ